MIRVEKWSQTFWRAALAAAVALAFGANLQAQTNLVTPAQYLTGLPKPHFRPGHRLPHLTRWGWNLSTNANIELANNWGYCLEFGSYATPQNVTNINNPGSFQYTMAQLARNNPDKYKLSVLIDRNFPDPIPDGFYSTNNAGWFIDSYGNRLHPQGEEFSGVTNTVAGTRWYNWVFDGMNLPTQIGWLVVSPEGPEDYWNAATQYWIDSLKVIQSNAPISILLNGGEYGLDVSGWGKNAWSQDPRVQSQAVMTNQWSKTNLTGMSWPRYASNKKAHLLGLLTAAINNLLPDRELSIFYNTGNEQNRYTGIANWFDSSANWGWNSDVMVTNTDLPSFEDYYTSFMRWTTVTNPFVHDILSEHLNAVGYNIGLGHPLNYSWVCGGWSTDSSITNTPTLCEIPRYYGFLKCLYTSGMVGGVAGYFSFPTGGFDAPFDSANPPHWLLQMIALSRVHALFSRLDTYLYDGDLLKGDRVNVMVTDQPGYEFSNTTGDATARVLARKLRENNQWLITAWAAAGPDRFVTVTIPGMEQVQVLARASGAVYVGTSDGVTLVDKDGLLPTASVSTPPNFHIESNTGN